MGTRPRGPQPGWAPSTARQAAVLDDLIELFDRHAEQGTLPRSSRGAFYDLRPHGLGRGVTYLKRVKGTDGRLPELGPMEADPATVQEILVMARRAGLIAEGWVADERAPDGLVPPSYADAEAALAEVEWVIKSFELDLQAGQDRFVEVWCESANIAPRLAIVAEPYGVPVYAGGGFDGLKGKREAAERVASRDVPTLALHVGDYDTHGRWIFKAKAEDVAHWIPSNVREASAWWSEGDAPWMVESSEERLVLRTDEGALVLDVRRFAVTVAQVANGLVELDEEGKAEAEAMPPAWQILTDELDAVLDPAHRERVIERGAEERRRLVDLLASRWTSSQ